MKSRDHSPHLTMPLSDFADEPLEWRFAILIFLASAVLGWALVAVLVLLLQFAFG